jgi:Mn-dependent DtxR family transcriptional regulator
MSSGSVPARVIEYISKRNSLSLEDLANDLNVSRITAKNYLSRLENMNTVKRVGRGLYQVGSGKTVKAELNPKVYKLAETLRNRYQFADLVIWSLSMLSDYSHYAIAKDLMFVETDETTSESIKDYLKENGYNPTLKPEKKDYRDYTSIPGEPVFILERGERYEVKDLTPSPEKVWLDIYYLITRKDLSFSPGELGVIFANMLRGEGVNFNRLRRYAHRRGVGNEVTIYLCELRKLLPDKIPEGALGEAGGTLKLIEEMVDAASD